MLSGESRPGNRGRCGFDSRAPMATEYGSIPCLPHLPPHISPRYIRWMSEGPTYQVSIVQKQPDGRNDIRILLRTKDREAANYLVGSLEQDGQPCKLEVIPPGKGDL